MAYLHPEDPEAVEQIYTRRRRFENAIYPASVTAKNGTTHWPEGKKSNYESRGKGSQGSRSNYYKPKQQNKDGEWKTVGSRFNKTSASGFQGKERRPNTTSPAPCSITKELHYVEREEPFDEKTLTSANLKSLRDPETVALRETFKKALLRQCMWQGMASVKGEEYMRATQEYWASGTHDMETESRGYMPANNITVYHTRMGQHHRVSARMTACGCEIVGMPTLGKNRAATCLWRQVLLHEVCGKCNTEDRGWFLKGEREAATEDELKAADNSFHTDDAISAAMPSYKDGPDKVALANVQEVCGGPVLNLLATMAATENIYKQDITMTPIADCKYTANAYQPLHDFAAYFCTTDCIGAWIDKLDPAITVTLTQAKITAWRLFEENQGCAKKTLDAMRARFINSFDLNVPICFGKSSEDLVE